MSNQELEQSTTKFKINFGISSLSRYYPGVPWEERVIEIPLFGFLPTINTMISGRITEIEPQKSRVLNYQDVRGNQFTELQAVRIDLKRETPSYLSESENIYLIWIKERGEWIAFYHSSWIESGFSEDEYEAGPYALDGNCITKLLGAYSIPLGTLEAAELIQMNPQDLEEWSR